MYDENIKQITVYFMAKVISTDELKSKLDEGGEFHLVDALSPASFEARHIPRAKNVPNGPNFLEQFEEKVGAPKDAEVIVYCSSANCMASVQAAEKLEEAGYGNVSHYKDGLAGWKDAGHQFEGEAA